MLKAGTETGSLVNHIMADNAVVPEVGMGVTVLCWTDRHAGTITHVTPKTITVQRDKAIRVDKNGMSENQEWRFEPDPLGSMGIFRLTKRGWRNAGGNGLAIGERDEYYDFSF